MTIMKSKKTYFISHIRSSIFRQLKNIQFFCEKISLVAYSALQLEHHSTY